MMAINGMRAAVLIVTLLISIECTPVLCKDLVNNNTCWTQAMHFCMSSQPGREYQYNMSKPLEHVSNLDLDLNNFLEQDCYPWMFRNKTSGACECSDIPYRAVLCDPTIPRTSILIYYCMTYNPELNNTELGLCLYGGLSNLQQTNLYNKLPQDVLTLNEFTCNRDNSNRDATLCGACKPGLSPLVYSYNMSCINCTDIPYNWIKYIAAAYVPLTVFYIFVVICKFNGTSPLVKGLISICQGLVSPVCMRAFLITAENRRYINYLVKIFSVLYGIWNLDFFRTVLPPICLNITPLQALFLDYAVAFYPLLLVLLTYILISLHSRGVRFVVCLCKPFHRLFVSANQDWDLEGSVLQALATFFLLSFLKILNVTTDLLVFTEKYVLPLDEQKYQTKYALYYDASMEYFKGDHLYYGIAAIVVGLLFVILPVLFLIIYPMSCFQKCLNKLNIERQSIDLFVNCYQGYYKDGTNGTRNWRCFSLSFFLIQIIALTIFTLSRNPYCYSIIAFIVMLFLFSTLAVQPYKEQFRTYSVVDAFMLLLAGGVFMISAAIDANFEAVYLITFSYSLMWIMAIIPGLYWTGLAIWWIFIKKKCQHKLCCFQYRETRHLENSNISNEFPDRVLHPVNYEALTAPLLSVNQTRQEHKQANTYGTVDSNAN